MNNTEQPSPPALPGLSHAYILRALLAGRNEYRRVLEPYNLKLYPDAWNNEMIADAKELGIVGYTIRYTCSHERGQVPAVAQAALASQELTGVLCDYTDGRTQTAYLVYAPNCRLTYRLAALERLKLALGKAGRI